MSTEESRAKFRAFNKQMKELSGDSGMSNLARIEDLESQVTALTEANKNLEITVYDRGVTMNRLSGIIQAADKVEHLSASPWIDVKTMPTEEAQYLIIPVDPDLAPSVMWFDHGIGWDCMNYEPEEYPTKWMPIPPITSTEDGT